MESWLERKKINDPTESYEKVSSSYVSLLGILLRDLPSFGAFKKRTFVPLHFLGPALSQDLSSLPSGKN